jgi:hypothetical protein
VADNDRSGRGTLTLAELVEASGVRARTMPLPRRSIVGARIPMGDAPSAMAPLRHSITSPNESDFDATVFPVCRVVSQFEFVAASLPRQMAA